MQKHDLEQPTLISSTEASKFLRINQRNIVRLRNKGREPYYRMGKALRYSRRRLLAAAEVAMEVENA
jgi:hypothetical protein